MPWVQRWNALFGKPLLNQCIAILQRDQTAALAVINTARTADGNAALPPIQEFHKGPGLRTAFPWLTIWLVENPFDIERSQELRVSAPRIELVLDAGQFDQEMAQEDAADYARLLDMIIMSAGNVDWETALPITHETVPSGTTTPPATGTVKLVWVEDHRYGVATLESVPAPVLRVTLPLQFSLVET